MTSWSLDIQNIVYYQNKVDRKNVGLTLLYLFCFAKADTYTRKNNKNNNKNTNCNLAGTRQQRTPNTVPGGQGGLRYTVIRDFCNWVCGIFHLKCRVLASAQSY